MGRSQLIKVLLTISSETFILLCTHLIPLRGGTLKSFFSQLNVPTLSSDVRNCLEALISQEEVAAAISSLQSGKSPGPDGFPSEFYKKNSVQLAPLLTLFFLSLLSLGLFPQL